MKAHIEEGRLQDFGEGLLPPEEEERVRAHLELCSQCRNELESLSLIREGLGELPTMATPSRDLWPQIAWRMERVSRAVAPGEGEGGLTHRGRSEAGPQPTGRKGRPSRLITLPAWQFLAASITIALISGGSAWAILSSRTTQPGGMPVPGPSVAQMASLGEAYVGLESAIADFEAVLERGREVLDPRTVAVLEENLGSIDQAIRDASEALAMDPASAILRRILGENLRKKVDVLRSAAVAVYANT